ncbi:MAG: hypothetical protein WAQ25_00865 [Candidatus Saccharimonas sp.]
MEWIFDPWVIGCAIGYALFFCMWFFVAYDCFRRHPAQKGLALCVIHIVVWNSITYTYSESSLNSPTYKRTVYVDERTVIEALGLQSGKDYPVLIGARLPATDGTLRVTHGLFYSDSVMSLRSGSNISIGFKYGDKSQILEVPTRNVTFIDSGSEPASATFTLLSGIKTQESFVENVARTGCRKVVRNLTLIRECTGDIVTPEPLVLSEKTQRQWLAPLIHPKIIDSVVIKLPEGEYLKLLG